MSFDENALPIPDLGLRCLRCGYLLAGLPLHRCPECGRQVVLDEHIPPGDFPVVIFGGDEVALTPDVMALLRAHGILYMPSVGPLEVAYAMNASLGNKQKLTVPRADYFRVIDLLRRREIGEPLPPPEEVNGAADWECPACGESSPGTFEVCWNCGAAAPSARPQ